ncbi:MAG: carboxymuconolactone decarboxylase family protein [Actinomycetota bacterium]
MARLPFTDPGRNLAVNIFRVMSHAPEAARGFSSCGSRLLGETKLDTKLRELAINAISLELGSPYEWSHHAKWALDVGATPEDLEALKARDLTKLTDLERAVVEYALKVERNEVSEDDVERLRSLGLDDQEVVEVTLVAGFYGMTARFLNAMDVEYDPDVPRDFEVPAVGGSRARENVEGLQSGS